MFNRLREEDDEYYGWGNFTLKSPEAKKNYIASMMCWEDEDAPAAARLFNLGEDWVPSSVDHQSVVLTNDFLANDLQGPAKMFLDQLIAWLERDDVVILGGNDNSDGHPAHSQFPLIPFQRVLEITANALFDRRSWCDKGSRKVIYDNGSWVVFTSDGDNPQKIRWSFNPEAKDVQKSSFPELVDIKISDYCPYGCAYCYQGSTKQGKHASLEDIERIATELSIMGCFEVALGGGEPTLHPDFKEILELFYNKGIVANFTTRNVTSLLAEDSVLKEPFFKGHVAISVETGVGAESIMKKVREAHGWDGMKRIVFHYVMGSTPLEEMAKIIRTGKTTLLGYKTTGFGSNFKPHDYSNWRNVLDDLLKSEHRVHEIGIDTALAVQSDMSGIPPHLYYTEEGRFSFYIDAVKNTFAPSSFCPPEKDGVQLVLPLTSVREAWQKCPVLQGDTLALHPRSKMDILFSNEGEL